MKSTDIAIKTVILCGGIGYRLKEETEFKPKPMVEVGGKPILWHIMKIYSHFGFKDFIIALGYKGNLIKDYFVNQKYYDDDFTLDTSSKKINLHKGSKMTHKMKITFVDTGLDSLTGERVRRIKRYITGENFMVTYGDGLADIDISALLKFHRGQKTIGTVSGVYPILKYGGIYKDNLGTAIKFEKKAKIKHLINGGFMVFNKKIFDLIEENSMLEDVFNKLIKNKQMSVYEHRGFFYSMDTYQDMQDLNKMWEEKPAWKIWG